MSHDEILAYLKTLGNLQRYDRSFKKLFVILQSKGLEPESCSTVEVANALVYLHHLSQADARNAYAAACLFPHLAVRFCPILTPFKKLWNVSNQKYATFWDPEPVLHFLRKRNIKILSLEELRTQLILCWRLLALHRGIDLARTVRTISQVGSDFFILLRRKGWKNQKWEQIIKLDSDQNISPWHLLQEYVKRTSSHVQPGSPLLWSLEGKKPLSSNTINSITKHFMQKMGIPTTHWQAHSTRGAGVLFYKKKGFHAEEVCELGSWKNSQAFTAHYLRLGVAKKVQNIFSGSFWGRDVHKTSPPCSAEPDGSHTHGRHDPGGSDPEGEAQKGGEPNPPARKRKLTSSSTPSKRQLPRGGPLRFEFAKPVSETLTPTPAPTSQ